jgi:hypothetical protein
VDVSNRTHAFFYLNYQHPTKRCGKNAANAAVDNFRPTGYTLCFALDPLGPRLPLGQAVFLTRRRASQSSPTKRTTILPAAAIRHPFLEIV